MLLDSICIACLHLYADMEQCIAINHSGKRER